MKLTLTLILLGVILQSCEVFSALPSCESSAGTVCVDSGNAYCATTAADGCTCNINFEHADSSDTACSRKACASGGTCTGTGTVCKSSDTKCYCTLFHTTNNAACDGPTSCTASTASLCTDIDANSFCDTSECKCLVNYDATDSACVQKTCTTANVATNCDANSMCTTDGKCQCLVNYAGTTGACVQKTCTTANVATNCDANSMCTAGECVCTTDWVAAGDVCKKSCTTATVSTLCGNHSVCTDSKCECQTGYTNAGDGVTCKCSADSACHANGQCSNGACVCKTGFSGDGITCTAVTTVATVTAGASSMVHSLALILFTVALNRFSSFE